MGADCNRTTKIKAQMQARMLRDYWQGFGCTVNVEVVDYGDDRDGNPIWGIRSDMIGGLPRDAWERKVKGVRHD